MIFFKNTILVSFIKLKLTELYKLKQRVYERRYFRR